MTEGRPVFLPQTRAFDIGASMGGEPWRVFVHVPPGEAPPAGWPLLVLTDGNAVIGTAVETLRIQGAHTAGTDVAMGVVASVGYPVDTPYCHLRRSLDLSPPPGRSYPPGVEGGPPVITGGADDFLRFVEGELMAFIETLAPIDLSRRTLSGHSFGGLFALHALFSGSSTFTGYVAASPSIYWDEAQLLGAEARFTQAWRMPVHPVAIHVSAGEYEGDRLAPFQYGRDDTESRLEHRKVTRTVAMAREMAERLGRLDGITTEFEEFAGETHMTLVQVFVSRAIRLAFRAVP